MPEYKFQHYLPRSYLAHFAGDHHRITVRRRGAEPITSNISKAGGENHLYSVVLPDGTRDVTAEKTLSKFETVAARALNELRNKSQIPRSGSQGRQAVSLFLGLQMTRTPEQANRYLFAQNAIDKLGGIERIDTNTMHDFLRDHHLGFDPEEPEVKAATDIVHAMHNMGLPTKAELLQDMFDTTMKTFAPLLSNMQWSLERSSKPRLATCDRLPAIWCRNPDGEDYKGFGIMDADELWFPVSSYMLLILRRNESEKVIDVDAERFEFVNSHLSRHCYQAVFHEPSNVDRIGSFPMATRRPSVRFWTAPLIDDSTSSQAGATEREALHQWIPYRDG
jgi:hypothetical protein